MSTGPEPEDRRDWRPTRLQAGLCVAMLLTGAAIGPFVYAPLSTAREALGAAQFALSTAAVWLLSGFVIWLLLLAVRRRRDFARVLFSPWLLGAWLAFNARGLAMWIAERV